MAVIDYAAVVAVVVAIVVATVVEVVVVVAVAVAMAVAMATVIAVAVVVAAVPSKTADFAGGVAILLAFACSYWKVPNSTRCAVPMMTCHFH